MQAKKSRALTLIMAAVLLALLIPSTAFSKEPEGLPLHVKATGFASDQGTAIFAVFAKVPEYPADLSKALAVKSAKIASRTAEIEFESLRPGKYVVVAVHDENGNGKLDLRRKGVPAEALGYFKRGQNTPPTWDEAVVDLASQNDVSIIVF